MRNPAKENASNKQPGKETAEANDPKNTEGGKNLIDKIKDAFTPSENEAKPKKTKLVKVKITGMVAWLGLPHAIGQIASLEKKQAEEVVKAKRGKYV